MKSKMSSRLATLGISLGLISSSAFAADAAEESKQAAEGSVISNNTPAAGADNTNVASAFWGNFAMKSWSTNMSPWDGAAPMAEQFSLTGGYKKYFLSVAIDGAAKYVKPISNGSVEYINAGWNLGYLLKPNLIVALGLKNVNDAWVGSQAPASNQNVSNHYFFTIGADYSYVFAGSPFSIIVNASYGQRPRVDCNCVAGAKSVSETYFGYVLGGGYALSKRIKFDLFYRIEQWDMVTPALAITSTVAMTNRTAGGPGVGVLYTF